MNIYEKLAAVQQELKAPKDKKNTFAGYSYRSAEGILEAVKPLLAKYKCTIVLDDEITVKDGRHYVAASATFVDCETESGDKGHCLQVTAFAREAAEKKGLDVSQVTGTASSYARKYALNGLLLIDDTKDADTDEYVKQTQETPEKASEMPEKPLSDAKRTIILELAKRANIDIQDTGEDLDNMTERRGNAMIVALKKKLGVTE